MTGELRAGTFIPRPGMTKDQLHAHATQQRDAMTHHAQILLDRLMEQTGASIEYIAARVSLTKNFRAYVTVHLVAPWDFEDRLTIAVCARRWRLKPDVYSVRATRCTHAIVHYPASAVWERAELARRAAEWARRAVARELALSEQRYDATPR